MSECRRSPDYRRKSELLKDGTMYREVKRIRKSEFAAYALTAFGEVIDAPYDYQTALEKRQSLASDADFQECEKIIHAQGNRTFRLRTRVEHIINDYDNPTFCTLTFSNDYLASTNELTRRRYVTRFLKEQSGGFPYVANVDYGKKNGREHYHAVCGFRLDPKQWQCGALRVQKVRKTSEPIKLAKYISKLTNHAIKETAKRNAIIYSR